MKKSTKQSEESRQTMWEMWFVASVIILLAYLFVGTLEGSKTFLPNWLPFMLLSMVNLIICIYKGCTTPKQ